MAFNNFFNSLQLSQFSELSDSEIAAHDAEIERMEKEQAEKEAQKAYERTGVPTRYYTESFDTFVTDTDERKRLLSVVKRFVQGVKCGKNGVLVLIGKAGTGKTHCACSALRELGGKYKESAGLVEAVKQANSFGANTTPTAVINNTVKCNLLVIDEIGRAKCNEEPDVLFRVLNVIYNENKSAILVGNFKNQKSLFDYVGAAFVDRLVEIGSVCELYGESYRNVLRSAR